MLKSILKIVAIAALVVAGAEIVSEAIKETSVNKTEDDNVIDIVVKFSKNIFEKGFDKAMNKTVTVWNFIKSAVSDLVGACGWFKNLLKKFETNHRGEASVFWGGITGMFAVHTIKVLKGK